MDELITADEIAEHSAEADAQIDAQIEAEYGSASNEEAESDDSGG